MPSTTSKRVVCSATKARQRSTISVNGAATSVRADAGPGPGPTPTRRTSCTAAPRTMALGAVANRIAAARRTLVASGGETAVATPKSTRARSTDALAAAAPAVRCPLPGVALWSALIMGRPSCSSAALMAAKLKPSMGSRTIGSSSPDRCSRSRTNRAIASPRNGCESPPTRRSRRPSGVVTMRPRTSGTAQIVSSVGSGGGRWRCGPVVAGAAPTAISRSCTSTPHSAA